jgi:hypothetical protein
VVARVERVVPPLPKRSVPSVRAVSPVPPLVVSSVPETVGVKRREFVLGTIVLPKVRPP